jgi:hypothetical protein
MAAQLITLPYRPVINVQGGFEAGALLDVYLSGTTTRVQLYDDADLSSNLTNPVVADAVGSFPAIYFDDSVVVRVRVRPADGGDALTDIDPYITDFASVEAAKDAAELAATNAALSETAAQAQVELAEDQVDLAEAAAVIAQAFTGPLYANTTLGLAATTNGQGFAVDNADGTADVYVNASGTAVQTRTIIIDPTASGTAAFIGTTGGDLQSVLDAIGGSAMIDLTADVTGILPIANGGTGGGTAPDARTALGAAASGANTDITALDQDVTVTATGTIAANSIGYRGLPANAQTGAYAFVLADAGKLVPNTTGGFTIPANASVAFPIGTTIVGYNASSSSQSVAITSDTLRLAGTATTGTRTLLQRGFVTLVKVVATEWVASGNIT